MCSSDLVYPDYHYPVRGQKRKGTASAKETASSAPSEPAPKRKRLKVLTHRPRFIEQATVPEFGSETSSAPEAKESTPLPGDKELAEVATTKELEEPKTLLPETKELAEGIHQYFYRHIHIRILVHIDVAVAGSGLSSGNRPARETRVSVVTRNLKEVSGKHQIGRAHV